ncbi:hypothetical protein BU23DRAFT_571388 [Bimuria novae-zelandiae CBS 107.79]|uniref:Uncharacterized protein n=1 Tax=Bimuria novae-zelandiae CBS 107.79 TaxID=1447943 RepID=A0A6A5V8N2_9PLEO|nr:hypothetical protein BU23DRAFT_571388 [Bimuria novae-zelandiae CBS 107.79]
MSSSISRPTTLPDLHTYALRKFPSNFSNFLETFYVHLTTIHSKFLADDWLSPLLTAPPLSSPIHYMLKIGTVPDGRDVSAVLDAQGSITFIMYDFLEGTWDILGIDREEEEVVKLWNSVQLKGPWAMLRPKGFYRAADALWMICSAAYYMFMMAGKVQVFQRSRLVTLGGLRDTCEAVVCVVEPGRSTSVAQKMEDLGLCFEGEEERLVATVQRVKDRLSGREVV